MMGGNYLLDVMRLIGSGRLEPGKTYRVDVYHDDWCAVYRHLPCDCHPDVCLVPAEDAKAPAEGTGAGE
jgi:hypothetical protein